MKKAVITFVLLCSITTLIWGAVFFWKNLRGMRPALTSPSRDIVMLFEKAGAGAASAGLPLQLPPGFSVSIFAKGLDNPRVMTRDPNSTMLVSVPSKGKIVALPDLDGDGTADRTVTVIDGLKRPHGLALRYAPECRLYIAEEGEVNLYSYDPKTLKTVKRKKIADLPEGGGHVTRTLLFHPAPHEDRLLISVGSSCNVCNEEDWRRSKVLVVPADGGKLSVFASGLRNSVFMTVHPKTGKIWATEMGRDLLGDDLPPDEINIIEQGRDYGWPFCYGRNVHDTNFDPSHKQRCREPETYPSHIDVPAHSAPLGLAFVPAEGWPVEFRSDLLVAYHGSWNRSVPTGYKVVRHRLDSEGKYLGVEDFITGWLTNEGALGRPADIMILPDGRTIFISDDKAGVIYRVYRKDTTEKRE